jgi:hypothetical protein
MTKSKAAPTVSLAARAASASSSSTSKSPVARAPKKGAPNPAVAKLAATPKQDKLKKSSAPTKAAAAPTSSKGAASKSVLVVETSVTAIASISILPPPISAAQRAEIVAMLKAHKEIKKLIDMGAQRGQLTFVEVAEQLPVEIISPEQLDEVMNLLSENEIEVIESTKRAKSDEEGEEEGFNSFSGK